jgi:murein L,D-transpeptidase YcbB/YkuD
LRNLLLPPLALACAFALPMAAGAQTTALVVPGAVQAIDPAPPAAAPPAPRRSAAPVRPAQLPTDTRPSFGPGTLAATEAAVQRYRAIVAAGGWPRVSTGADSPALRARLAAEGDLASAEAATPAALAAAIRRFQLRHGLRQSGRAEGETLKALAVPAEARLRQLEASLARLQASAFPFGERYVVVNIPSATVEAVEAGTVKRRYVAVVGKKDRASPAIETRITDINFNPTWTVPTSIIRKDIIPKMQKDPGYLTRANIRILDGKGAEVRPASIDWSTERAVNFTLRQDPGAGNSLGAVRINMPNNQAVYMHDTPSKRLFAQEARFHSSGCVRVADVKDFTTWLLADRAGWSKAETDRAIAAGERKDVRLPRAVPVAWTYLTGYASADGTVHFRPDVYDLDARGGGAPLVMQRREAPSEPVFEELLLTPAEPPPPKPFWEALFAR